MKRLLRCIVLVFPALWLFPASTIAQDQAPPLDGPQTVFHDDLLDKMAGSWELTGKYMGMTAEHTVKAEWLLNHQFLRIHEADRNQPKSGPPYEAIVMVGYDNASERYVVHWTDIFGGRASETLGYGTRSGDGIDFVFEYPDGPWHTIFRWKPETKTWQWLMRTKNKAGQWRDVGEFTLTRQAKN